MTQVFNFADDTTFYVCDKYLNTLINRLEHNTALAAEWFESNFMKLNQDKCHLLVSGHKHETAWANISETKIWESNEQKLLGVVIDRDEFPCVFDLLTWMSHGRRANSKINHIHERALRIVYKNNALSFEESLELDKSFKIYHINIQSLAIELFKIKNNLSVTIMIFSNQELLVTT